MELIGLYLIAAGLLVAAGVGKAARPDDTARAMVALLPGTPSLRLVRWAVRTGALAEAALGLAAIVFPRPATAALVALSYLCFFGVVAYALSLAPLALLAAACGGSSSSSSVSDSTFCGALKPYLTVCPAPGTSQACLQAQLDAVSTECGVISSQYSTAYKNAVVHCPAPTTCMFSDPFLTPCFEQAVLSAPFTAAQTKLANDYCALCASNQSIDAAACPRQFWGIAPDGGASNLNSPGGFALLFGDSFDEAIDTKCLAGAAAAACGNFSLCAEMTVAQSSPALPQACARLGSDAGM